MSTEELLETRIKIIAGWPGMEDDEYQVGQIHCGNYSDLNKEMIEKYPHLFKPLQWWEEREEKDMPKYLKIIEEPGLGEVLKLSDYEKGSHYAEFCYDKNGLFMQHLKFCTPSTEFEYNEYLKQSKK